MNKNKIKSKTQEICPNHLAKKIKLFTGKTTTSGEWEEGYFCPQEKYYDNLLYNSGMTGVCVTPMGDFRGHSPKSVGLVRHWFSPDEEHYMCSRCGKKHTELSEGGGGGSF